MIFVDGHVHIYDCFDISLLLGSALKNFNKAAGQHATAETGATFVLMITEGKQEERVVDFFPSPGMENDHELDISEGWRGSYSAESDSVTVFRNNNREEKIHLVRGCQVVTIDKIEVLGFFCHEGISDGMSLPDTVKTIREKGGIPVLPWGVGKWVGKRGKIIEKYIQGNPHKPFFVGDNGGRPNFWLTPALFEVARRQGVQVLPGSDPLPVAEEENRVGGFGFFIKEEVSPQVSPVLHLKHVLLSGENKEFIPYGNLLKPGPFFLNQLRIRI